MTELEIKQVKVDNWGIFFLQRLKHFFNRTDYCDLTLQFQDNAQLKVHRLVLSACTEYFELLERTCEMYEDCLVMPDDLQADVVVPIVNFMYTGQLEFRMDLLERLFQTSQIMNMPVLTKLLEAHRNQVAVAALKPPSLNYGSIKRSYSKSKEPASRSKQTSQISLSANNNKRSHNKAFGNVASPQKESMKKSMISLPDKTIDKDSDVIASPSSFASHNYGQPSVPRKVTMGEPRPTRYELPEELDTDNIFEPSFASISYSSQPLVVHPDSEKQYKAKRSGLFGERNNSDTVDILECTKVPKRENIYDDDDPLDRIDSVFLPERQPHVSNQFFDQVVDHPGPKVTIETKDSKQASNIDHAKIISEVLKKYPHLVKSNKNIKLKILDTPSPPPPPVYKPRSKKMQQQMSPTINENPTKRSKGETDYTYESDVLDSKEAARLIALGAENVKGPWICLICGTPGKALHFASYYNFRRHLVDVHKEKPIVSMCEYCGLKSLKRNYLLHHLLTKHGVTPPPTYSFPKCNSCDYVALTESLLVKHKLSHGHEKRSYRCNVCVASFITSNELLAHIQATGHKYCDRKTNLQCIYCQKVFLRESNLFAHLKTYHKQAAKTDGIIEDSDDESREEMREIKSERLDKYETHSNEIENDDMEAQYQIKPDGNLELITKKSHTTNTLYKVPKKQTILNAGFSVPVEKPIQKVKPPVKMFPPIIQKDVYDEEIVVIGNNEYIMRGNQLILKKKTTNTDLIIPEIVSAEAEDSLGSDYATQDAMEEETLQEQTMIMKKTADTNQPIQIVVSNEEEYKALMNSNHSIIFDDGDTSKTLTVLSTPEPSAAMNSSLDLENAQSTDDMMIIQDNYSLNVSQAIPSDNSNIVVVYSHPVDEQNKQYQIITSTNIGAQFIQPSAVISQNFQTTSSSVRDSQVVDTQTAESWQNAIPQNNQNNDEIQEIHEISIDHSEITQVTPHVLSGLPEVSLTSIASQQINEVILEPDIADNSISSKMPTSNVVEHNDNIDEPENVSSSSLDADTCNVIISTTEESTPLENLSQDHVAIDTEIIGDQDIPEKQSLENEVQNGNNIEENPSENLEAVHTHNEEKIAEHVIVEANEDARATLESDEYVTSKIENVDDVQNSTQALSAGEKNISEKIPTDKIQNLTSEWSEEDDVNERPNQGEENVNVQVAEESQEMEESIENIQQEMDKQVNDVSGQVDTETDSYEKTEDEQSSTNLPIAAPPEKISSLLNDWEENDSQEENVSANGTAHESKGTVPTEVLVAETGEISVEGTEPKKVDKIQSLVSDWDDEEEDKEE